MIAKRLILTILLLGLFAGSAHARLKVIGKGAKMEFDPAGFPPKMKEAYALMRVKCTKCHTLERAVVAITTGIAPISNGVFDRTATKAYGIKMLRKPDSNMSKHDVHVVIDLLNYMLDQAAK